jgi:hypothetical protein
MNIPIDMLSTPRPFGGALKPEPPQFGGGSLPGGSEQIILVPSS